MPKGGGTMRSETARGELGAQCMQGFRLVINNRSYYVCINYSDLKTRCVTLFIHS